jgi:hypothetical protein
MQIRKLIQRRIRRSLGGVDFQGDVNAAVAANVGERSQTTRVSSHSSAVSKSTHDEGESNRDRHEEA